jgi:hypothetical protein
VASEGLVIRRIVILEYASPMWHDITTAPLNVDLELAVIDAAETHALMVPCRRVIDGWIDRTTNERIDVRPTHWRAWAEKE